jgi:hypothetical protein
VTSMSPVRPGRRRDDAVSRDTRTTRNPYPRAPLAVTRTVSVVVPCYNYGHYLPQALTSVLDQTGVDVEVIVVDDVSPDDSLAVARQWADQDSRVRVIAREHNGGPVAAFNEGLEAVTGDYLVRLDADDLLTPGALERAVRVAEQFPSVGLVYGHPLHFSGDHLPPARDRPTSVTVWRDRKWFEDRCETGRNVITSPEVLMRTSVVREVGGQAALAHTHDMEHWLRIAAFSDVAYIRGVDQAWHREHDRSLSSREVSGALDLEQRLLAFDTLFESWGTLIDPTGILEQVARGAISRTCEEAAIHALDARLSWQEEFVAYRSLALRTNPESELADIDVRPEAHIRSMPDQIRAQWRRLRRRVMLQVSRRRWHRHGIY